MVQPFISDEFNAELIDEVCLYRRQFAYIKNLLVSNYAKVLDEQNHIPETRARIYLYMSKNDLAKHVDKETAKTINHFKKCINDKMHDLGIA